MLSEKWAKIEEKRRSFVKNIFTPKFKNISKVSIYFLKIPSAFDFTQKLFAIKTSIIFSSTDIFHPLTESRESFKTFFLIIIFSFCGKMTNVKVLVSSPYFHKLYHPTKYVNYFRVIKRSSTKWKNNNTLPLHD